MNKTSWKKTALSIPMTISSVGTLVSLLAGKKWHIGFGVLWSVLSFWHALEHSGKMKKDAQRLLCAADNNSSELKKFASQIKILSFIPGRVRVYHSALVNNAALAKQLEEYVLSFTGVKNAVGNILTGSFLVEYDPERLRTKKGLAALEQNIMRITSKEQ